MKQFISITSMIFVAALLTSCATTGTNDLPVPASTMDAAPVQTTTQTNMPGMRFDRTVVIVGHKVNTSATPGRLGQFMDELDNMRVSEVFNSTPASQTVSWTNRFTNNQFALTPGVITHKAGGQRCRDFNAVVFSGRHGEKSTINGRACSFGQNEWRIVG